VKTLSRNLRAPHRSPVGLSFTEKSGDRLRRQSEQAPSPAADVTFRYTGPDTRGLVLHPNLSRSGTGQPRAALFGAVPTLPSQRKPSAAAGVAETARVDVPSPSRGQAGVEGPSWSAAPRPSRPGLTSRGGLDLHNLQRVRSGIKVRLKPQKALGALVARDHHCPAACTLAISRKPLAVSISAAGKLIPPRGICGPTNSIPRVVFTFFETSIQSLWGVNPQSAFQSISPSTPKSTAPQITNYGGPPSDVERLLKARPLHASQLPCV
jgi:hypothetical protein